MNIRIRIYKKKKGKKLKKPSLSSSLTPEKSINQTKKEIHDRFNEIRHYKKEIEKMTESAIRELRKICVMKLEIEDFRQRGKEKWNPDRKGTESKTENNDSCYKFMDLEENNGMELDYELANMLMIKKVLDLSENLQDDEDKLKILAFRKKVRSRLKRKRIRGLQLKESTTNGRKKILIVEDDPTTANIIRYILTQHNFRVSFSLNAEDGLKLTLKERPDLIILDIMLPGMDGFQLLSILKENEETVHIPVILISSLTGEKDILRGLEIGATDYIIKPFSPQILFHKVKKIIRSENENIANNSRL